MQQAKLITTHITLFLALCLLINPTVFANGKPIPGRWEKTIEPKPEEKIRILMKSGIAHLSRFQSIGDEVMICSAKPHDTLKVDLVAVDKIVVLKAGKYAQYGALLGAAGGLGLIATITTVAEGPSAGDLNLGGTIGFFFACVGIGYVAGAGIGGSGETIYISKEAALKESGK